MHNFLSKEPNGDLKGVSNACMPKIVLGDGSPLSHMPGVACLGSTVQAVMGVYGPRGPLTHLDALKAHADWTKEELKNLPWEQFKDRLLYRGEVIELRIPDPTANHFVARPGPNIDHTQVVANEAPNTGVRAEDELTYAADQASERFRYETIRDYVLAFYKLKRGLSQDQDLSAAELTRFMRVLEGSNANEDDPEGCRFDLVIRKNRAR